MVERFDADLEAQFRDRERWLLSLIRDPAGYRFVHPRPPEEQAREDEARLRRMRAFLAFLGEPQTQFKSIHVAGTSGKGSITALIATLLTAAGQGTAHHISPYLQLCTEKLIVDGRLISPSQFIALVDRFRAHYERWVAQGGELRYGEGWVALTYLWFAELALDWGVMETGRGGRFDATNVIPSRLAVISNVAYDHVRTLGPELSRIAWHKAGIIQPGRPVVTAAQDETVLAVLMREAAALAAPLFRLGDAFDVEILDEQLTGTNLRLRTPTAIYDDLHLALPGAYQAANAAVAVTAVALLAEEFGFDLTEGAVRHALATVRFPGRLEVMQTAPTVILDGAHNTHKVAALVGSLRPWLEGRGRVVVIFGSLASKEADGMLAALALIADHFILTAPEVYGKPATLPETLAGIVRAVAPGATVATAPDVATAVQMGLAGVEKSDLLLMTGSLYLVGAAREHWVPARALLAASEAGSGQTTVAPKGLMTDGNEIG